MRAAWKLARPGLRGKLWELFYFAESVVLWRHCRRLGTRHLHVHHLNQASDATMLAIELEGRDRGGRPRWSWSFTMHGPDEFSDQTLFRLREKARSAARIACISDFARSQVMALLDEREWDKLRVVHCGLVADDFPPPAERPPHEELRILYVGRMVPVKGQSVLLDACAALIAEGIRLRVAFVGEGPMRPAVERLARERGIGAFVDVVGAIGQDALRERLADADVFVLPSFAEGVPVVLMEAMAMELPVLTTRIAGISELVEDGIGGLTVPPGRPDLLADGLRRLNASPGLRRQLGRRGRQKVIEDFDVRAAAAGLESMFVEVLKARGP
jgi:glycosyltransferase involved in cell wall biosynthesis